MCHVLAGHVDNTYQECPRDGSGEAIHGRSLDLEVGDGEKGDELEAVSPELLSSTI